MLMFSSLLGCDKSNVYVLYTFSPHSVTTGDAAATRYFLHALLPLSSQVHPVLSATTLHYDRPLSDFSGTPGTSQYVPLPTTHSASTPVPLVIGFAHQPAPGAIPRTSAKAPNAHTAGLQLHTRSAPHHHSPSLSSSCIRTTNDPHQHIVSRDFTCTLVNSILQKINDILEPLVALPTRLNTLTARCAKSRPTSQHLQRKSHRVTS